jgi:methyltransferase (TIGR00027 family)
MNEDSQGPQVSFTARVMAAVRALESRREDALFHDPLAEKLAGPEAIDRSLTTVKRSEDRPYPQVRTRFLDDFLQANAPGVGQIVLLGAGLDTRAFRMDLRSDTHLYEIDQQVIFDYKNPILADEQPRCFRHVIVGDIRQPDWSRLLLDQGFQPEQPSIWIAEGVLYYLDEPEVRAVMELMQKLTTVGSYFAGDVINAAVCHGDDKWAKYWQWSCDQPEAFFHQYGWQAQAIQPGEPGACFDRYTLQPAPRHEKDKTHIFS